MYVEHTKEQKDAACRHVAPTDRDLEGTPPERKKETLRKGWGEVPPWVFHSKEGTVLYPSNIRTHLWTKLLQKAELRHIRLHDLRHTYANLLIQHGESLANVKEQMGHHSIKITVDTYGHLMPGGNKAAVDRLDGLENAMFRNPGATNMITPVLLPTRSH